MRLYEKEAKQYFGMTILSLTLGFVLVLALDLIVWWKLIGVSCFIMADSFGCIGLIYYLKNPKNDYKVEKTIYIVLFAIYAFVEIILLYKVKLEYYILLAGSVTVIVLNLMAIYYALSDCRWINQARDKSDFSIHDLLDYIKEPLSGITTAFFVVILILLYGLIGGMLYKFHYDVIVEIKNQKLDVFDLVNLVLTVETVISIGLFMYSSCTKFQLYKSMRKIVSKE
ncbi:hypothetical protein [Pseudobutyrivibrio sp. MD2005]|uniref:hypothetical protein n=1 Tax=Pseudobutyrivibrio sp. MD2005 TaxID=1410616 RepID=UPI00047FDE70|nr:hypothetical protein [Pseudobutyrivibrio sp. MD2005]